LVGATLTLTAWLFASPPGSSPDDGYHLGSIWCANGYRPERCLEATGTADRDAALVPAVLSQLTCVAGDGRVPANCQNGIYERFDGQLRLTAANISGTRATLYYRTANLLISDDIAASVARIRVMNAIVVLIMIGLTLRLAAPDLRRAVLAAWVITSLPHGVFLLTSLNSTAWGLVGVGAFLANAVTGLRPGPLWHRLAAAALAVIGAAMALGSRTEAGAHLAVITIALASLWLTDLREQRGAHRRTRRQTWLMAALGAFALLALTTIARFSALPYLLDSGSGLTRGWDRLVQRGISNPALTLAAETPQLWTGALGTWSLGWLDTNMPSTVSVSATVVFAIVAAFGLSGASRGRTIAVITIFIGMVALPVISLLSSGLIVLEQLQPRHYLPLLYAFLVLSLIRSPGQPALTLGRGTRVTLASALSIGHSVALIINIRRYTHGLTEYLYIDTNRDMQWWWGGTVPSPEMVWLFGSLGFAMLAFSALHLFGTPEPFRARTSAPARQAVKG
jgi:hypothetical protein